MAFIQIQGLVIDFPLRGRFISLKTIIILKLNVVWVMSPLIKTGYLPLVTSLHLLGDPPSLPLWIDVIY